MTLSLSNHLAADSAALALRRDVLDGLHADAEIVAAQVVLRLGGQRSVRPDHPAARVLPDPRRGADPARRARRRSPPHPARTRWSSSAAAPRRRPGCCSTRCATPDRCAGSSRSTSTPGCCRRPVRRSSTSIRASRSTPSAAISRSTSARSRSVGRRLVVFLGSTIGNLTPGPRADFLPALSDTMQPGDTLLLGTDLVKDAGRLVRAYDDSAGVTAQFNRNVLAVVNRELDADFDLDAFEHVARWNADEERIEMWLRASARTAGAGRGAGSDRRLRRRRGDAHRGVVQVPARRRGGGVGRRGAAAHALVDRSRRATSGCRWPTK